MLFPIVRKNKIFRALCMVMLLLIHLDAYAYEIIGTFQVDWLDEAMILSESETLQEEEANWVEWGDFSYSKPSVRSFFCWLALGVLPLFFICFRNIVSDILVSVRAVFLYILSTRSYVTFCSFLI